MRSLRGVWDSPSGSPTIILLITLLCLLLIVCGIARCAREIKRSTEKRSEKNLRGKWAVALSNHLILQTNRK